MKINIIGAGFAGVETAFFLANKGFQINLFERWGVSPVMPAQAGIQLFQRIDFWIPACAGMTTF